MVSVANPNVPALPSSFTAAPTATVAPAKPKKKKSEHTKPVAATRGHRRVTKCPEEKLETVTSGNAATVGHLTVTVAGDGHVGDVLRDDGTPPSYNELTEILCSLGVVGKNGEIPLEFLRYSHKQAYPVPVLSQFVRDIMAIVVFGKKKTVQEYLGGRALTVGSVVGPYVYQKQKKTDNGALTISHNSLAILRAHKQSGSKPFARKSYADTNAIKAFMVQYLDIVPGRHSYVLGARHSKRERDYWPLLPSDVAALTFGGQPSIPSLSAFTVILWKLRHKLMSDTTHLLHDNDYFVQTDSEDKNVLLTDFGDVNTLATAVSAVSTSSKNVHKLIYAIRDAAVVACKAWPKDECERWTQGFKDLPKSPPNKHGTGFDKKKEIKSVKWFRAEVFKHLAAEDGVARIEGLSEHMIVDNTVVLTGDVNIVPKGATVAAASKKGTKRIAKTSTSVARAKTSTTPVTRATKGDVIEKLRRVYSKDAMTDAVWEFLGDSLDDDEDRLADITKSLHAIQFYGADIDEKTLGRGVFAAYPNDATLVDEVRVQHILGTSSPDLKHTARFVTAAFGHVDGEDVYTTVGFVYMDTPDLSSSGTPEAIMDHTSTRSMKKYIARMCIAAVQAAVNLYKLGEDQGYKIIKMTCTNPFTGWTAAASGEYKDWLKKVYSEYLYAAAGVISAKASAAFPSIVIEFTNFDIVYAKNKYNNDKVTLNFVKSPTVNYNHDVLNVLLLGKSYRAFVGNRLKHGLDSGEKIVSGDAGIVTNCFLHNLCVIDPYGDQVLPLVNLDKMLKQFETTGYHNSTRFPTPPLLNVNGRRNTDSSSGESSEASSSSSSEGDDK